MITFLKTQWQRVAVRWQLDRLQLYFERAQLGLVGPTFAYYVLLTFFPIMMAIGLVATLCHISPIDVYMIIQQVLPTSVNEIVGPVISSVLGKQSASLLSVTVIVTLWSLSRVVAIFRKAFHDIAADERAAGSFITRLFSFVWVMLVLVIFLGVLAGISFIRYFAGYFLPAPWLLTVTQHAGWVISAMGLVVLIVFNAFLPDKSARLPFRYTLMATLLEAVLLFIVNHTFSLYVELALGHYDFYQSIGSIIVVLVWLNLVATLLVSGHVFGHWLRDVMKGTTNVSK